VRDNIAAFGGDPSRITIFGQSAGAASVDYYSYAYTQDPIVNAFIPQSGTAISFTNPPPTNNSAAFYNASIALGCGGSGVGSAAALNCVRTKSTAELLNVTRVTDPLAAVLGNFGPTSDNQVVFSNYRARAEAGQFIRKPYLTGNNDYEAGLFKILAAAGGINVTELEWQVMNLATFTCPSGDAAAARARYGVPTYRYRYFGEFPNLRLTITPPSGAWHGAEIPVIWQTTEDASGQSDTTAEDSISQYLSRAWAAFAKNPSTALSQAPYNFPQYSSTSLSFPKTPCCPRN